MIFDEGYVHCDPHPGNVLVDRQQGGNTQIVLLDHGLYTQLSNKFRYDYADFWLAIINRDVEAIKTAADNLGVGMHIPEIAAGLDPLQCNVMQAASTASLPAWLPPDPGAQYRKD